MAAILALLSQNQILSEICCDIKFTVVALGKILYNNHKFFFKCYTEPEVTFECSYLSTLSGSLTLYSSCTDDPRATVTAEKLVRSRVGFSM